MYYVYYLVISLFFIEIKINIRGKKYMEIVSNLGKEKVIC